MGQKINPTGFRVGYIHDWKSNWFDERNFSDALVEDDATALQQAVLALAARGIPARHRSEQVEEYRRKLAAIDPSAPPDGPTLRRIWPKGEVQ